MRAVGDKAHTTQIKRDRVRVLVPVQGQAQRQAQSQGKRQAGRAGRKEAGGRL
jgi:hypothetical protein